MLIDFSKKRAYWLLFCYQWIRSNWTLVGLKRNRGSLLVNDDDDDDDDDDDERHYSDS